MPHTVRQAPAAEARPGTYRHQKHRRRVAKRLAGGVDIAMVAHLERVEVCLIQGLVAEAGFAALVEHYRAIQSSSDALRSHRALRLALDYLLRGLRLRDPLVVIFAIGRLLAMRDPVAMVAAILVGTLEKGIGSLAMRRVGRRPRPGRRRMPLLPLDPTMLLRDEGDGARSARRIAARLVIAAEHRAVQAAARGRDGRGRAVVRDLDDNPRNTEREELGDLIREAWVDLRRDVASRHPDRPGSGPRAVARSSVPPPQQASRAPPGGWGSFTATTDFAT